MTVSFSMFQIYRLVWLSFMTSMCLSACIHDSVLQETPVVSSNIISSRVPRLFPRSTSSDYFQPLRVTPWYLLGENAFISQGQIRQLKIALQEVTQMLSSTLSVHRSEGSLLLNRDISRFCRSVWRAPNDNKCAYMQTSYQGEKCLDVTIPDFHLQGVKVWSDLEKEPRTVIEDGAGVPDTDFLLYVQVAQTQKCAAQVALHELLHTLGFSSSLYASWLDCSLAEYGEACSSRTRVTNTDENGQFRIYTPTVMQKMGEHLGVEGVGAPLENKGFPNLASSHWESRFFQGSIMTALLSPPHLTHLDPITLAAFTDMGWYKVNATIKSQLMWGKGAGRYFGLPTTCQDSSTGFFCTGSKLGCHHLHLDKGNCSTDSYLEGCHIYSPLIHGGECWRHQNSGDPDEIFHAQSRCFYSNLTKGASPNQEFRGRCYLHQCLGENHFQVKVHESEWTDCPAGAWIQVAGYEGFIQCPSGCLCLGFQTPHVATLTPTYVTGQITTVKENNVYPTEGIVQFRVQVEVSQRHKWTSEIKSFLLDEVLGVIAQKAGVQRCFLQSHMKEDLDLSFAIVGKWSTDCPPTPEADTAAFSLLTLNQDGAPYIIYNSSYFSTVSIRFIDSDPPALYVSHMLYSYVIGGGCCAVCGAAIIFALFWYKLRRQFLRVGSSYPPETSNHERPQIPADLV
ncbi:leishmanolysin-like peptidase 2 isoform X2 [Xenopus laevis]|uniref:Leishmanolysin-like peptidase n=1 Tax=Xenopus laevis TaxID=8355 RepID=A0A8J1KW66_XENLA|nr:leishmanolysin-like peptidase 2 isoform X2 [Xenopus laevis]